MARQTRTTTRSPSRRHGRPKAIKVGDTVYVRVGAQRARAVVVEDRGHIGIGGRQLLRIRRLTQDEYDPEVTYEVPAEEVTPAE